jgi:nitrogen fixation/metabolism regulation signal transduction histidine kinase
MNSLRSRLILAFALVAVVPLVIVTVLLSQRIQQTVRAREADRLATSLGMLEAGLRADVTRMTAQLAQAARDPALRRLVLVEAGGPDLTASLSERRVLLGLDILRVTDPRGVVLADAADAAGVPATPAAPAPSRPTPVPPVSPLPGDPAVTVVPVADASGLAVLATVPLRYQGATEAFLEGGVLLDSTRLARLAATGGIGLVLRDATGRRVAGAGEDAPRGGLTRTVPLAIGAEPHASLTGIGSMAVADRALADLRLAGIALALAGLAIAIVLGTAWSRQISRPVERLAAFSERIARGEWEQPVAVASIRELETLVAALDRMRRDLREYRERLVAGERHAAWSAMARQVAHEVRNPLTPIAVSIADLKRSYEQDRPEFPAILEQAVRTVGDEIHALRRLLEAFSELGRMPEPRPERTAASDVLDDLRALYDREVAAGRLAVADAPGTMTLRTDRALLRQALVNLTKNGLEATESSGHVHVSVTASDGACEFAIADDGPGLSEERRARLFEPGGSTKPQGSGLGLTIVARIVHDLGGTIAADPPANRGTTFRIRLPAGEGDVWPAS